LGSVGMRWLPEELIRSRWERTASCWILNGAVDGKPLIESQFVGQVLFGAESIPPVAVTAECTIKSGAGNGHLDVFECRLRRVVSDSICSVHPTSSRSCLAKLLSRLKADCLREFSNAVIAHDEESEAEQDIEGISDVLAASFAMACASTTSPYVEAHR